MQTQSTSPNRANQDPLGVEGDLSLGQRPLFTKSYDWVLFDADETLFHFDAFQGLKVMFSRLNYEFTREDFLKYEAVNRPLWVEYQNGAITASELQTKRFEVWAEKLGREPAELNSAFLDAMADICSPLNGAVSLLTALRGQSRLGIITNGFIQLQRLRLERTGLLPFCDVVIISEEVAVAKPDRRIFDYALSRMGNPSVDNVLMVGDNPHSDIKGGLNAGMDTCWFNRGGASAPAGVAPHFQVSSLKQLEEMFVESRKLKEGGADATH